jgi:hypothetical protein
VVVRLSSGEERARARVTTAVAYRRRRGKNREIETVIRWLRSTFHGVTGHADRLTGRAAEASGQNPVSSWHDRTHPVRADRTRTESGQSSPGNPSRMTGRDGGVRDRTQWSQGRIRSSVRSKVLETCLRYDRTRWW